MGPTGPTAPHNTSPGRLRGPDPVLRSLPSSIHSIPPDALTSTVHKSLATYSPQLSEEKRVFQRVGQVGDPIQPDSKGRWSIMSN